MTDRTEEKKFRHEWKHEINQSDRIAIRQRLRAIMKADTHAVNGVYTIRSLYFDTLSDKALREKIDGVSRREKFRLRYYNEDSSFILLEKKSKQNGLGRKQSVCLKTEEVEALLEGRLDWMLQSGQPLVQELYVKMKSQGLVPKTIVAYTREPFVYFPGNVRVTLDYDIRTGLGSLDFLNPDAFLIPASDKTIVLEVKWDAFLPAIIRTAVNLEGRETTSFSKYAVCRRYG
ncbi:MAG: polyphosphate polymerase domain-containing protein [Lachnospiraceae bacterium]|jgi:SPX domain protein involved in polyphosphate accumulation|nr:polyphosphate polymerase domain-containing protein [Lachnospiraceae bacterium]